MARAPAPVQILSAPTIVVKHKGLLTVALMLGTVMQVLDTTIANVALPHMAASLGAAQNATGNWVKVVQRIPVRIKLPAGAEIALLKTGMSAAVSIDTGHNQLDKMLGK